MPRNVRNFWIELEVDGKKTKIATGPKSSGGGFNMTIRIREKGAISERTLSVFGVVHPRGNLGLYVEDTGTGKRLNFESVP